VCRTGLANYYDNRRHKLCQDPGLGLEGGETNRRTRNPHPGYRILDSMQVSYSEHSRRQPQSPSRSCFRWLLCGALGKLSLCHVCVTAQSSKQGVPSAMPSHAFPSAATVRMRDMQDFEWVPPKSLNFQNTNKGVEKYATIYFRSKKE